MTAGRPLPTEVRGDVDDVRDGRRCVVGCVALLALFAVAAVVAHLPGVRVHVGAAAPFLAAWRPRVGLGTLPALVLGGWACSGYAARWVRSCRWGPLLAGVWALGLAWMLSLALVDSPAVFGSVLEEPTEYLRTARRVDDVPHFLATFVDGIPAHATPSWPTHVAGHPPGATLVFVLLDRLGLSSGASAGLVICAVAATTPLAVLVACRSLGAEDAARTALPFLVFGPSAVWQAVSADALFAAVAAWTVALAVAGASRSRSRSRYGLLVGAGALLGGCLLLSYGLALVAVLVAGGVLAAVGRRGRAVLDLLVVAAAALVVLALPALWGFELWRAYPVLRQRYWDGVARVRPGWYWIWANLAVLALSAGPVVGGGLGVGVARVRQAWRDPRREPVVVLGLTAWTALLLADLSLMSKAEVERIWLPFVPWMMLLAALLPTRWRRPALALQVVTALLVQHLLLTPW